jgi:uncharacterized protein YjeT (DUF2065 family)
MISHFFSAIALLFVLEGIFPFVCPESFRKAVQKIAAMDDLSLRMISFLSMVLGLLLLYTLRS